jgi:hypothetical protein
MKRELVLHTIPYHTTIPYLILRESTPFLSRHLPSVLLASQSYHIAEQYMRLLGVKTMCLLRRGTRTRTRTRTRRPSKYVP